MAKRKFKIGDRVKITLADGDGDFPPSLRDYAGEVGYVLKQNTYSYCDVYWINISTRNHPIACHETNLTLINDHASHHDNLFGFSSILQLFMKIGAK